MFKWNHVIFKRIRRRHIKYKYESCSPSEGLKCSVKCPWICQVVQTSRRICATVHCEKVCKTQGFKSIVFTSCLSSVFYISCDERALSLKTFFLLFFVNSWDINGILFMKWFRHCTLPCHWYICSMLRLEKHFLTRFKSKENFWGGWRSRRKVRETHWSE